MRSYDQYNSLFRIRCYEVNAFQHVLLAAEHYIVASVLVLNAMKGFYNAVATFSDVHQDLHRKLKL